MSQMVRKGFTFNANVPAASPERAKFVKARLAELARNGAEILLETGVLLKEYRDNGYFKEDGYESFDNAIDAMHDQGLFEYRSRNARNMIAVVEMAQAQGLSGKELDGIGISKLREIASLPASDQKKMLEGAKDMSVAEVQKKAKEKRAKAKGHDVDPLDPVTFMATATQKTFVNTCIEAARRQYGLPDSVTPTGVLVDHILADWYSGLDQSVLEEKANENAIDAEPVDDDEDLSELKIA